MHKKIDIYLYNRTHKFWAYECSTNRFRTCLEAKRNFMARHNLDNGQVRARFDHDKK